MITIRRKMRESKYHARAELHMVTQICPDYVMITTTRVGVTVAVRKHLKYRDKVGLYCKA